MVRPTPRSRRRARRAALVALLLSGLGAAAGCADDTTAEAVHVQAAGSTDTAGAAEVTNQPEPAPAITFEVSRPRHTTIEPAPLLPLPVLPPAPPAPPAPPPPAAEVSAPDAPTTP